MLGGILPPLTADGLLSYMGLAIGLSLGFAVLQQPMKQIEDAIISLERLARGRGKRRGRPPAWMKEAEDRRETRAATAGNGEG